jgi:glycosyltransferase involved in cell wall biosynthesis
MKLLLWHGYLLSGTGSNIYARMVTREWSREGHDVTVFSQEPHPELLDLGGATTVKPDVDGFLPVFILDRYEGYTAKRVQDTSREELDRWVEANARALREHLPADLVFTNHVLMGGPVGEATGGRYAVKAHGSELEYSMRGNPGLSAWGHDSLQDAAAVIAGSAHIRQVIQDVCGDVPRVHEVPPGVDVDAWQPRPRAEALAALLEECEKDPPNPGNANERLPDEGNGARLSAFFAQEGQTVVYFGKLMHEKGVQLLIDALRTLGVRAVIVGFGDDRAQFEAQAEGLPVLFTGALEHRHLTHLAPLGDVSVVPSIFPEAFGMVAAEAAAAGCPPIVAYHSGLAEIADGLEEDYPDGLKHLASFTSGDAGELTDRLRELLALGETQHQSLCDAARRAAVERWSWRSVGRRLLEAAELEPGAA